MGQRANELTTTLLQQRQRLCRQLWPTLGGTTTVERPTSELLGAVVAELTSGEVSEGNLTKQTPSIRVLSAAESWTRTKLHVNQRKAHLLAHLAVDRAQVENLPISNSHLAENLLGVRALENTG